MGDFNARIRDLKASLGPRGVDGLLVTDLANLRYLTGFTGSSARLLLTKRGDYFFTDSRYRLQASAELKGLKVRIRENSFEQVAGIVGRLGLKRLGFEGGSVSYDTYRLLKKSLSGVRLKSISGVVEGCRCVKDTEEVGLIRRAVEVATKGFKAVERRGVAGRSELDVALTIESVVKKAGAEALSFDTIVASGERSALPHGKASGRCIRKGDLVIVDMGVSVDGYKSDETRTYAVGKATKRQREVYSIVKDAHDRAIDAIRAGVRARDVDRTARGYIRKAGYGRCFGHGTGHGVGLQVHERPFVNPKSNDVLEEGMIVTVEPGIYIPGWGGVRIEDMVLVEKDGCDVLTGGSKELRILR